MNINMKFLMVPALALISGVGVWGQATKVAIIDMQAAIQNTQEGKAQIADLEKKYGPKQAEFQKRAADIQTKTDQLNKTRTTISDEARAALESDITRMKTALQRDSDDAQQDSDADEQKMVQGIYGKLVQAATKVATDNQIMLVFDVSSQPNNLVCCGSAQDITKDVIAAYDKMAAAGPAPAASAPANTVPRTSAPVNTAAPRPPATTPARPPAAGTK